MSDLLQTPEVQSLLTKVSGLGTDTGDARVKRIVHRVVSDLFKTIEEFDVQPDEFWATMSYLTELGQASEVGLLVPGLGLETFLDLRTDAAERKAGVEGGTPRTIEGPLYVAGAPLSKEEARLDDGSEEVLLRPIPAEIQPAPPYRDRCRGPLSLPLRLACGLRVPA